MKDLSGVDDVSRDQSALLCTLATLAGTLAGAMGDFSQAFESGLCQDTFSKFRIFMESTENELLSPAINAFIAVPAYKEFLMHCVAAEQVSIEHASKIATVMVVIGLQPEVRQAKQWLISRLC